MGIRHEKSGEMVLAVLVGMTPHSGVYVRYP
jgi:hypothetical protein